MSYHLPRKARLQMIQRSFNDRRLFAIRYQKSRGGPKAAPARINDYRRAIANRSYARPFSFRICSAFDLSTAIVGSVIFFSTFSPLTTFKPCRTPSAPGVA
jgi:hypothetical protein